MLSIEETFARLSTVPHLQVSRNESLSRHTRFELGGPALLFADTEAEESFVAALRIVEKSPLPWLVIGLGTNLIVSDAGFAGVVLRYRGSAMSADGLRAQVQAGAVLQDVVDFTASRGMRGLESMTGIPGNVGAAIYGNAGAYGSSMSDVVAEVRYYAGGQVHEADARGCEFRYRGSVFKQRRLAGEAWLILSAELRFVEGDASALVAKASEILATRNEKYPPTMKCAGSIFKNLILAELPERARAAVPDRIVKGGKVPSAFFLEQAGAKGLVCGGVHVTDYHSNTLYNDGTGTAAQFCELVTELKRRVRTEFGLELEEEVQYIGFEGNPAP
jgi:UDP-N-acetylmuramate dehydrogenase